MDEWRKHFVRETVASAAGTYLAIFIGFVVAKAAGAFSEVHWGAVFASGIPIAVGAVLTNIWGLWPEYRKRRDRRS